MTALRVFQPDDDRGPAEISVRQAFETYLLPSLAGRRKKSTISQYRRAVTLWEQFSESGRRENPLSAALQNPAAGPSDRPGPPPAAVAPATVGDFTPSHPPGPADHQRAGGQFEAVGNLVSRIADEDLNRFGAWLISPDGAGLSIATAEKTWRFLRAILARIGPRGPGSPRAVGLLDRVPSMDPLTDLVISSATVTSGGSVDAGPVDVTDEQLGRIYAAAEVASWPDPLPALQWRTLLVIYCVMGPRVNDGATLRPENFVLSPESPNSRSSRRSDHGWLVYLPTKTRAKKPARLIVPLPECVAWHVGQLLKRRTDGKLFSWNDSTGKRFRDQWSAIVTQAGLADVQRRYLRSTADIRWSRASESGELGRWVLGHAARDVNEKHYLRHEADLIEAAGKLELPAEFVRATLPKNRQLFLDL